jgi:hypothetical protein
LNQALALIFVGTGSLRKTGFRFSGSCSEGALAPKKEARPKRTGHTLLVAAQYSQKSPENNALFAIWLADFGLKTGRVQRL